MSTDAVPLHDLSQYVNTGIPGSDNLAQRKIGPLNHSRWLTHATRIERLQLLLSTNHDEPFYSNLVLLATYITAIYFTGHMEVKYKPSITDSPAHFYDQIRRQAQYFSGDLLKVLQKNLLMKKTRDELLSYVDTPFSSDYPSHTQRVETGVKLTTAGAARVVGQKRQVGECLMVEASRKKSPGRVTRKRFNI